MAVHLLDQARLMHERAVEDHNLIAFHHAVREPNHTPTGLCERVDERNFLIVQGDEHIVVGKQPGELGRTATHPAAFRDRRSPQTSSRGAAPPCACATLPGSASSLRTGERTPPEQGLGRSAFPAGRAPASPAPPTVCTTNHMPPPPQEKQQKTRRPPPRRTMAWRGSARTWLRLGSFDPKAQQRYGPLIDPERAPSDDPASSRYVRPRSAQRLKGLCRLHGNAVSCRQTSLSRGLAAEGCRYTRACAPRVR